MPTARHLALVAMVAILGSACSESTPTSPSALVAPSSASGVSAAPSGATVDSLGGRPVSPAHLERAGWFCVDVPGLGIHCFPPKALRVPAPPPSIEAMVFDSATGEFLGTEILIRDDLYADQPCRSEGGSYAPVPGAELGHPGVEYYYACHHYEHEI